MQIYNKSCESMKELLNNSVDLIITDPPFNIATSYEGASDNLPDSQYWNLISNLMKEIQRVLKLNGKAVFCLPQWIIKDGNKIDFPLEFELRAKKANLQVLAEYDYTVIDTHDDTQKNTHALTMKLLILANKKMDCKPFAQKAQYIYRSKENHPCPLPQNLMNDLLDTYFEEDMVVLDPFMGIADLGVAVLKRRGSFIGYEISPVYFTIAKQKLEAPGAI